MSERRNYGAPPRARDTFALGVVLLAVAVVAAATGHIFIAGGLAFAAVVILAVVMA